MSLLCAVTHDATTAVSYEISIVAGGDVSDTTAMIAVVHDCRSLATATNSALVCEWDEPSLTILLIASGMNPPSLFPFCEWDEPSLADCL